MTLTTVAPAAQAVAEIPIDYGKVLEYLKLNPRDPKAQALVLVCKRYDLDPVLKHVVIVDGDVYVTHKGLLHVAHRSGFYDGTEVCDQGETDTHWTAVVAVYRSDMGRPFKFPGRYPKLRGKYEWEGPQGSRKKVKVGEEPHPYGPEMAIKTAETAALRRAFDVSVSVAEERWDLEDAPAGPVEPARDGDDATALERAARPELTPTTQTSAAEPSVQAAPGESGAAHPEAAGPPEGGRAGEAAPAAGEWPDWLDPVVTELRITPTQVHTVLQKRHDFLRTNNWRRHLDDIAAGDRAADIAALRKTIRGGGAGAEQSGGGA